MRRRVSPATMIACVALFFSLAGTGIAASRYLITSTSQIKPSVLRALEGQRGMRGLPGRAGSDGVDGIFSAANLAVVKGPEVTLCAYGGPSSCVIGSSIAQCPAGTTVVSGGYTGSLISGTVPDNQPLGSTAWEAFGINQDAGATHTLQAVAVCAP